MVRLTLSSKHRRELQRAHHTASAEGHSAAGKPSAAMERSMQTLASELERQRSHAERLCRERDSALRKEQLLSARVSHPDLCL